VTKRTGTRTGPPKYTTLADEIVHLRDQQRLPFREIARRLGVSKATAGRAYDYLRPNAVREAAARGTRPQRGRYRHLPKETVERIKSMLRAGCSLKEIAGAVGCSENTVRRERRRLELGENANSARSQEGRT
jgi:IS30 family transposase